MIGRSSLVGRVVRRLEGPCRAAPRWRDHDAMFRRGYVIVQIFYLVTLFEFYTASRSFAAPQAPLDEMDLLWPVWWLRLTGIDLGGAILAHLLLGAGLAGFLFWRCLAVRLVVSLALLEQAAFGNSFGAIHHGYHEWFWISVIFWMLPAGNFEQLKASRALRMKFLVTVGAAATLILLFYSMSGLWKSIIATIQLVNGQFGGFSINAMATTVAMRAHQTGSDPLWADLVRTWPILGWPLYLGLYYVELVAIAVAFRPALIRAWGVILILFHFGTLLFLDIVFPKHVLINAMFFVMSPFAAPSVGLRTMIAALPLIGIPARMAFGWSAVPGPVRTPAGGARAA